MHPTYKGEAPYQYWSLDSIPSLCNSGLSLVVCVDVFSKWVEILKIPSRESEATWQHFYEQVICRYGVPRGVRVD
jgi:hypothetical protein